MLVSQVGCNKVAYKVPETHTHFIPQAQHLSTKAGPLSPSHIDETLFSHMHLHNKIHFVSIITGDNNGCVKNTRSSLYPKKLSHHSQHCSNW